MAVRREHEKERGAIRSAAFQRQNRQRHEHCAEGVSARVDGEEDGRRKDGQQRRRGESACPQQRDQSDRGEQQRDRPHHQERRIAQRMHDEVVERRPGVVAQGLENFAVGMRADPAREQLVEKRLAHEKEDQAWNKKQRGDSNDGTLQLVVVNKSRKL